MAKKVSYSAKAAAAGKDIGKPGKNFAKIAAKSGGGEKGEKIAGAVLAKLRGDYHRGYAMGHALGRLHRKLTTGH